MNFPSLRGASVALALVLSAPLFLAADGPDTHAKGPEPLHISQGKVVNLSDYLVPGKTTIFDFYSVYCPPCRAIKPRMEQLHAKSGDVAVVEVDINRPDVKGIDWQSPVAREFGLESIPHFKVFGPDGKLVEEGEPAYYRVEGMLDKAGVP
jgi:thiol-disulfide isomerase/thioredoxin